MRNMPVDEPKIGATVPAEFETFEEWESGYASFLEEEAEGRWQVEQETYACREYDPARWEDEK